jgi:hypothetical protein
MISKLEDLNIKFSVFMEPDIDDEITAIALEPGLESKKICKGLALALSGVI